MHLPMHSFTGIPFLTSGTFSLQGTTQVGAGQVAPMPLPGAVFLFGSGLAALIGFARRKMNTVA